MTGIAMIMRGAFIIGLALAFSAVAGERLPAQTGWGDTKPAIDLKVDRAEPRDVDEPVRQAIVRDYSASWQAINTALANNNAAALNDNFVGFALDKLTQRVKDQERTGLRTRLVDRGHKVEAIFYSLDGSAMELKDTATMDTQILDGNSVIHSDRAQIVYYVVMTGAEDRWKVRVLDSAERP